MVGIRQPGVIFAVFLIGTSVLIAGTTPEPFAVAVGDFAGDGAFLNTRAGRKTVGTLDSDAAVSQSAPSETAQVRIRSLLRRSGYPDVMMNWTYAFGPDGAVDLVLSFVNGPTGTMRGTYETEGNRVTYRGRIRFDNLPGVIGRSRGSFRLWGSKFIVRDKVALLDETIRSKQLVRRVED